MQYPECENHSDWDWMKKGLLSQIMSLIALVAA